MAPADIDESAAPDGRVVLVLVLGDVGRSPRMQYHALSLAEAAGTQVVLCGLRGERPLAALEERKNVTCKLLDAAPLPRPRSGLLFPFYAFLKVFLQLAQLLWLLLVDAPRADVILVQTPPAIPALAVVWLTRAVRGSYIVADWHNLGYSVLAQGGFGFRHPIVRLYCAFERFFGQTFNNHLCVTEAMRTWLQREWAVDARVLYDRPPAFFAELPVSERHTLFRRLRPFFRDSSGDPIWPDAAPTREGASGTNNLDSTEAAARDNPLPGAPSLSLESLPADSPWRDGATPWTECDRSGAVLHRADAPALLVSSTSWTPDEDFEQLLQALVLLDRQLDAEKMKSTALKGSASATAASCPPSVVVVITGKGPLKEHFLARMRQTPLIHIRIATMWLSPQDYPRLLGSADLGVCLHASTSGLDLPMKVLDMFGSKLPVCARNFTCISELVKHDVNGFVFDSAEQLSAQLFSLLSPTPEAAAALQALRRRLVASEASRPRWEQNWRATAGPMLLRTRSRAFSPLLMRQAGLSATLAAIGIGICLSQQTVYSMLSPGTP